MAKASDTPPVGYGWKWVQTELDKRADERLVRTRLSSIEELAREAKEIALTAKNRAATHSCTQEKEIAGIKKTLDGWGRVKLGAIISAIVLIAAAVGQYFSLTDSVKDTQESISEVKVSVEDLRSSHDSLKKAVEKNEIVEDEKDKKRVQEIKEAVKEAVREARVDIKPTRARRQHNSE